MAQKEIVLTMQIGLVCPAPAMFYDSTYVLVFLNRNKKNELYVNGMSYGSKTLSLPEIQIYKSRIIEFQNILTIEDENEKEKQIIEWLVKCAENPVTGWEGIYELAPRYIPYSNNSYLSIPPIYEIPDIQKQKLRDTFFSIDTLQFYDWGLVDLFLINDSSEVKVWLVEKLKNKKYYTEFMRSQLKERIDFINNDKKKLIVYSFRNQYKK